jgi:signal peptidase II
MPRLMKWLAVSAVVLALDLYTKQLVLQHFAYGDHLAITGFFDLVRYHNTGAAFSFLADAGGWQQFLFGGIALIASVIIVRLLVRHPDEKLFCFALALVLGGALGNLYDRLTLGYVVDFLFFHYRQYSFPAFNVADSAISVGVALLLWDGVRKSGRK